jgi:F-type H+-transporting ATPase subunit delta
MATAQEKRQIAQRYVAALFALAKEQKKLKNVAEDMVSLGELLQESEEFAYLCHNPTLSQEQQSQALVEMAKKAKFHAVTSQFLQLLVQNRRLDALAQMVEVFADTVREDNGEVLANVQTATKLLKTQQTALKKMLEGFTGKKVELDVQQNPEILGGLKIIVDGTMVDASMQGRLDRMTEQLETSIREAV